jgi:hypothetical protein
MIGTPLLLINTYKFKEINQLYFDEVCQLLEADWWFSSASSINQIDSHGITEILVKVALKTHNPILNPYK